MVHLAVLEQRLIFKAANEYSKALKGTKTVGGIEIKVFQAAAYHV